MSNTAVSESTALRWRGDWRTTVFAIFFVPLFVALGFWQLQRAEEKRGLNDAWQQRQQQASVPLLQLDGDCDSLAYRKVSLNGIFLPGRDFLLDNRMRQGQYGFEVVSPFRLRDEGLLVLVNRGWIAGDPGRRALPKIPVAPIEPLQGQIYVPPGQAYRLGDETVSETWPQQMLSLDVAWMEEVLAEPVYPYTIRLEAQSPAALLIDWPVVNVSPEKHTGYAVQWFCMALALAILCVLRSHGRPEKKPRDCV